MGDGRPQDLDLAGRSGCRLLWRGLIILMLAQGWTGSSLLRTVSGTQQDEPGGFIVAFELSEENGFAFTWPFESMPPAPYKTVVMIVEKMPRARIGSNGKGEQTELIASRDLRINGRRQKHYRSVRVREGNGSYRREMFRVKLEEGRLQVSLSAPSGWLLDSNQKVARIKLYRP